MARALDQIIARYRAYCDAFPGAAQSPAATPAELAEHQAVTIGGRSVALDAPYLELVRSIDGLGADGVRLYPVVPRTVTTRDGQVIERMGVAQANRHWREVYGPDAELSDWLIYGLDDLAFFIRHLKTGRFQHRPRAGLGIVAFDCDTFEESLWEAFRYALELGDFER
jgi:hypothetical protein